jgi:hypothetical protein
MEKIKDYKEWFQEKVPHMEADGIKSIPPWMVMKMLDGLGDWETTYFKIDFQEIGKKLLAIASCTLIVKYDSKMVTRKGTVSMLVDESDVAEVDFSSAMLDLCVCDAAKSLGIRFGRELSEGQIWKKPFGIKKQKPYPSEIVIGKWRAALKDKNTKVVDDLEQQYDISSIPNFVLLKFATKR